MNIDTGLAVVIFAVLVFYLRLIILQRERAKRSARTPLPVAKKGKKKILPVEVVPNYSILSRNRVDQVIAGAGMLAILVGIALNTHLLPIPPVQPYWWIPTAAGIVAFSWAFKL
jgi:hypothetical protein